MIGQKEEREKEIGLFDSFLMACYSELEVVSLLLYSEAEYFYLLSVYTTQMAHCLNGSL